MDPSPSLGYGRVSQRVQPARARALRDQPAQRLGGRPGPLGACIPAFDRFDLTYATVTRRIERGRGRSSDSVLRSVPHDETISGMTASAVGVRGGRRVLLDDVARAGSRRLLSRLRGGTLSVHERNRVDTFGLLDPRDPLAAHVRVHSQSAYGSLLRGSIGLAETYACGLWDADDLVSVIRLAARNIGRFDEVRHLLRPLVAPVQAVAGLRRRNTLERSRDCIAAHYDLGNDLYGLFLDETMSYSAAYFVRPETSLVDAQRTKLTRICEKLQLRPGEHLLEFGTGWGEMAIHAARECGARVTTATISPAQHEAVTRRVREAGLQDRVTVLLEDYRTVVGTFDKLVAIEMIEAVGWRDFPTFFRICSQRIADHGAMLLQAITIDDRAYEVEKATRSFIKTTMFPGGCLPSVESLIHNMARQSDLRLVHLEDITPHYVATLQHWRRRFTAAARRLDEHGYDERFRRRWLFYLAYSEAGFSERRTRDVQLLMAKPRYRGEGDWECPPPAASSTPQATRP